MKKKKKTVHAPYSNSILDPLESKIINKQTRRKYKNKNKNMATIYLNHRPQDRQAVQHHEKVEELPHLLVRNHRNQEVNLI